MSKVLPSITTLSRSGNTWREKLAELRELPIPKVAVFLTGLENEERRELYSRLRELRKEKEITVPFVHAVTRMPEHEFGMLINEFGTEAFNLHPTREYPLQFELSGRIRKKIFIENSRPWTALSDEDIDGFAGVCLDMSHLEEARRNDPEVYKRTLKVATRFGIGANHLSALSEGAQLPERPWIQYQSHASVGGGDLDYLFRYPVNFFSRYCAIELENSLSEQVEFAKRIGNILGTMSVIDALSREAA